MIERQYLPIKKLHPDAKLPTRSNDQDAGLDLYTINGYTEVHPGERFRFSTGIAANIPSGYYLHIHTRSSMALAGWAVLGGVVDSPYKGELSVTLQNVSNQVLSINKYDRIAQAVIYPIITPEPLLVDDIGTSSRNDRGWGASGK